MKNNDPYLNDHQNPDLFLQAQRIRPNTYAQIEPSNTNLSRNISPNDYYVDALELDLHNTNMNSQQETSINKGKLLCVHPCHNKIICLDRNINAIFVVTILKLNKFKPTEGFQINDLKLNVQNENDWE